MADPATGTTRFHGPTGKGQAAEGGAVFPHPPVVTVGGLAGTGTSTLCRLLRDRLGVPYVYAGEIFRKEAKARGMSLAEFGALCQQDPSVDRALDARQVELLQNAHDGLILEGRLSGWLAHRERVHALKVWVTCDDPLRFRRIRDRDGGTLEDAMDATLARETSEADRYRRYYGIDLTDLAPYDLILDSSTHLPDALADQVETALRSSTF